MQIFFRGLESNIAKVIYDNDCLYRGEVEKILNMDPESTKKIMGNFALYLLRGEKESLDFDNMKLHTGNSVVSVVGANINSATIEATGFYIKVSEKVRRLEEVKESDMFKEFINYLHFYGFSRFTWADFSRMKRMLNGGRRVYPKFRDLDKSDQHDLIKTIAIRCGTDHDPHTFANAFAMEMMKKNMDKVVKFKNENIGKRVKYYLIERYPTYSLYQTDNGWKESFSIFQAGDWILNSL